MKFENDRITSENRERAKLNMTGEVEDVVEDAVEDTVAGVNGTGLTADELAGIYGVDARYMGAPDPAADQTAQRARFASAYGVDARYIPDGPVTVRDRSGQDVTINMGETNHG